MRNSSTKAPCFPFGTCFASDATGTLAAASLDALPPGRLEFPSWSMTMFARSPASATFPTCTLIGSTLPGRPSMVSASQARSLPFLRSRTSRDRIAAEPWKVPPSLSRRVSSFAASVASKRPPTTRICTSSFT